MYWHVTVLQSVLISLLTIALVSAWYQPLASTTWQIDYEGNFLDESYIAEVYDIDGFNATSALITDLHNRYHPVICYIDAGSLESFRPDAPQFPISVQGNTLPGFRQERWLDVRQISILKPLMTARAQLARSKGCDGIDWDNVDSYNNDSGFNLTAADQLVYNTMLSTITHSLDMAVGLKNDLDQVKELQPLFDFAVNESCQQYNECNSLLPFIQAGKPVWGINYSGITKTSNCALPNKLGFMMLLKTQSLDASGYACWQLLTTLTPSSTLIARTSSGTRIASASTAFNGGLLHNQAPTMSLLTSILSHASQVSSTTRSPFSPSTAVALKPTKFSASTSTPQSTSFSTSSMMTAIVVRKSLTTPTSSSTCSERSSRSDATCCCPKSSSIRNH